MLNFAKKRLGDLLIEAGLIHARQLDEALALQKSQGGKLGQILIERGYVTEKKIIEVLESQLGIPYVDLALYTVDPAEVRSIPENMAKKHEVIPIKRENGILVLAVSDPLNMAAFDDVKIYTGCEIHPVLADSDQINLLISRYFGSQKAREAVEEFSKTSHLFTAGQLAAAVESETAQDVSRSPAVRLLNILFEQAYQSGASDIHIEPQGKYVRIRFRIDGQLQDVMRSEIEILPAIVSRIKVMAGLNIAEKRLPQDGHITYRMEQVEMDLRVSILPAIFGEKIVIRLISKSTFDIPKEKLGFLPENLKSFEDMLGSPHGIILVTGPTGNGKTTTLYTAVKELNRPNVNIVTVEEPVETPIEGICQVQVNTGIGLTFANSLRSILRQDPDIIMIGEIRDSETAEIAVRSAITGHLVLSTLHTNDAASSVARLIDMGVPAFLVSTSIIGVVAQRLVRRICTNCRTSYIIPPEEAGLLEPGSTEGITVYRGAGCKLCRGTGYSGRIAVHEIMKVGSALRQAIYRNESTDRLREIAAQNGMITLRENCRRLVRDGITTLDEMVRVAYLQD